MKTFFYILQKCIKSKQITYPDDPFEVFLQRKYDDEFINVSTYIYLMIDEMYHTFKNSKIKNYYSKVAHVKLCVLNNYLNNIFISNELKEKILDIFCAAQRIYFAINKVLNIYRYKYWPLVVSNDLTLYPLDINHPATFVILQNKSRYLFSMHDLIHIIETAICNAPNFFASPLSPKNPYNNQKLNTSTLCNIYFKMKECSCKFSLIIHLFFLDCFVKHNFYINNEPFLREYSIKQYVYNSHSQTLYNAVLIMLKHNYHTNKLIIHEDFPKDMLVDIFRPYLFYHYIIHYSIKGTEKIFKYKNQLHIKLRKFYEYNNLFGRKIYTGSRRKFKKTPLTFRFITDHINFYNISIDNSKCTYKKITNASTNASTNANRLNRILHEYTNDQYDPDELFYTNELSNIDDEEYNSDYDDN
jgi:hypothetical protein